MSLAPYLEGPVGSHPGNCVDALICFSKLPVTYCEKFVP